MSFNPQDRMRDTTTSTSSPFTLAVSSPTQAQNFSGLVDGDTTLVEFRHSNTAIDEWMMTFCTYVAGVLTVNEVYWGSAGFGVPVTFTAGTIYAIVNPSAKRVLISPDSSLNLVWTRRFKAQDLQDLGGTDGSSVSSWVDKAGSGDPAAQATSGNRPVLKTGANGINSKAVVKFDGSNDYLTTAAGAAALTTNFYMAAVVRFRSLTGYETVLAFGDEAGGKRREMLKWDTGEIGFNGYSSDVYLGSFHPLIDVAYFVEITRIGTRITIYVNGVQYATGTPTLNAYVSTILTLAANNAGGENLNGELAEVFFSPDTSVARLRGTRSYVATEYGLTISNWDFTTSLLVWTGSGTEVSAIIDDGSTISITDRNLEVSSTELNRIVVNASGGINNNVLRLQQKQDIGYSCVYGVGHDVADNTEGYGFAAGWGNSGGALGAFVSTGFFEVYNATSSSFYPYRVIQTNNVGNYRRIECDASTAAINFYARDTAYSSETLWGQFDATGNFVIRPSAIATNATDGFFRFPKCAGPPTGTPTTGEGSAVVDSTNHKLYVYLNGTWVAQT